MKNLILTNATLIYIVLAVTLLLLSAYLGFLIVMLSKQKAKKEKNAKLLEKVIAEKRENNKESIIFIAKATLQGQCELSEACIRIKNLMDIFTEYRFNEELVPMHNFYNDLSGFAYLDQRNSLSKQDKFKQDNERFKVEQIHKSSFQDCLESIIKLLS